MLYRTLNNGVKMPMLGYGTFQVNDAAECKNSVLEAIRAGYRLIDTAQAYGNEEAVGAGIKAALDEGLCTRSELFITTKVWFRSFETEDCRKSLDESMKKLGVEYIDMVLLRFLVQSDVAVIPKSVHTERIRENIDIFDFELTGDEMLSLQALDKATPMIGKPEAPEKVEFAMTW